MARKVFVGYSSRDWSFDDSGGGPASNWLDDQGVATTVPGPADDVEIMTGCVLGGSVSIKSLKLMTGSCSGLCLGGCLLLDVQGDVIVGFCSTDGLLDVVYGAEVGTVRAGGRILTNVWPSHGTINAGNLIAPLLQNYGTLYGGCSPSRLQVTGDIENYGTIYSFQYNGGHIRGHYAGSIMGGIFRGNVHIDGDLYVQDSWFPLNFEEATLWVKADFTIAAVGDPCTGLPNLTAYLTGKRGRVIYNRASVGAAITAGRVGPVLEV